MKQTE